VIEYIAIVSVGIVCVFLMLLIRSQVKERERLHSWVCSLISEQGDAANVNHGRLVELAKIIKSRGVEEEAIASASLSPRVFDDRHGDDNIEADLHMEKADEEFLRELGIGEEIPSPQWDEH